MKRTLRIPVVVAAALAAAGPAAGAPAAWTRFCGDPVWCDPIRGAIGQADYSLPYVYPAQPEKKVIAGYADGPTVQAACLGAGFDANGNVFMAPFSGGLAQGQRVMYVTSSSLGAVTRDASNSGMAHGVRIDDPVFNGRPNAILLATRLATPGASTSPLGAWYDGAHWWIYNETLAAMAAGETFFYAEATSVGGRVVHSAANDYLGIGVYLDDVRLNGNPDAVVVAQHGFVNAYNPTPLGAKYDAAAGLWVVYNQDGSPLALGEAVHYVTVP